MLKADFHIHTKEDPIDKIRYNAKDLINHAAKLKFKVLAVTNHYSVYYNRSIADYAKKKGILLIPGMETRIGKKEVLLLNIKKQIKLKEFSDLERLRKENVVVVAPHPFYPKYFCLKEKLTEHINLFDGIEYCHMYLNFINGPNKKAAEIAKKYNKPLIGNSDAHRIYQLNHTFSLVDSNMNIDSVLESLRKGKISLKTKPLPYYTFSKIFFSTIFTGLKKKITGKDKNPF